MILCYDISDHMHIMVCTGTSKPNIKQGKPLEVRRRKFTEATVQITFIFIDFRVCDLAFAFKRKTHPAFRVLNVFYFQTDSICVLSANETFV